MALYDIWLCDDEAVYLRRLEETIAPALPGVRLRQFQDPAAVRAAAQEGLPDILILDIEFGAANGIALADRLCAQADKPVQLLYFTAYGERYCQRIFIGQVKPVGYLTKPVENAIICSSASSAWTRRKRTGGSSPTRKTAPCAASPAGRSWRWRARATPSRSAPATGGRTGPFRAAWTSGRGGCRRSSSVCTRATWSTCATSTAAASCSRTAAPCPSAAASRRRRASATSSIGGRSYDHTRVSLAGQRPADRGLRRVHELHTGAAVFQKVQRLSDSGGATCLRRW